MSDISDVQNALVAMVAAAVYPNGTATASVSGKDIVVYQGWPTSSRLDADLLAGKTHISVFTTDVETNKTRYSKDWIEQGVNSAGLTISVSGQKITIAGAVPVPYRQENVSITVSGKAYVRTALTAETPTTLAAALAVLVAADWPGATAAAGVIALPGAANITAALIGVTGSLARVLRTQDRVFQITVWASTPAQRDVIGAALDVALSAVERFTLADGFSARLIYRNSHITDQTQKAKLYRRDFQYSVEYSTTQSVAATQITQTTLNVSLSTT